VESRETHRIPNSKLTRRERRILRAKPDKSWERGCSKKNGIAAKKKSSAEKIAKKKRKPEGKVGGETNWGPNMGGKVRESGNSKKGRDKV